MFNAHKLIAAVYSLATIEQNTILEKLDSIAVEFDQIVFMLENKIKVVVDTHSINIDFSVFDIDQVQIANGFLPDSLATASAQILKKLEYFNSIPLDDKRYDQRQEVRRGTNAKIERMLAKKGIDFCLADCTIDHTTTVNSVSLRVGYSDLDKFYSLLSS